MSHSRRDFMKGAAVAGAAATGAVGAVEESVADETVDADETAVRQCPYFDQPMYCLEMSDSGKPLCEE